jgi:ABC-2 type transport system ATP-binding protein
MAEPLISVRKLKKTYGKTAAVRGISFDVAKGELFGLLGPNGAGKTTTMEIMETIKQPTSGSVTIGGEDVHTHVADTRQRIGVQLQSAGFYPDLPLTDVLKMFGVAYGTKVKPMKLLKQFDLTDKANALYKDLSGGQKQRFSLATTLVNDPDIIFLDEPTTGLDPQARQNLWEVIRGMKKRGVTIIMTTHYMDEAEQLCDRLAIMDKGKIIDEGTPEKLIKDLLKRGFKRHTKVQPATLEDVFLDLTGKSLRDG